MTFGRLLVCSALLFSSILFARNSGEKIYLVKAMAGNQAERSKIADAGIAIDGILSDAVTFIGTEREIAAIKKLGFSYEVTSVPTRNWDFPSEDAVYHNYDRMQRAISEIVFAHPDIATSFAIGKSLEGRDLTAIRFSSNPNRDTLPTALFLGCHHAREHLSVEVPLKLAQYLAEHYATDARIKTLLDTREVYIVPMVNPDGAEFDISTGDYQYWRKNRRDNGDGTFGVDLNRNYGKGFGGPGSSDRTYSDTYHGPNAFSEPETQAVRDFVRSRKKATVLLTFHTFSELVLWPWGGSNAPIANASDRKVFETMGKTMAKWNDYTPEKSSDLYLASGDTTDWAYDELKMFAFTFEMSPNSMNGMGGFYPGAAMIDPAFNANLEPALYMIEKSANPYSVLSTNSDPLKMID